MSSALSITHSVNPPRAVHLDFPLGHTAGKPDQPTLNAEIVGAALEAFETIAAAGEILRLPFAWAENDDWKDAVMRPQPGPDDESAAADDRVERFDTPQYQEEADRLAAEETLASGGCPTCIETA
jgi:hypothetical protein